MKCKYCGKEIGFGKKFCGYCGKKQDFIEQEQSSVKTELNTNQTEEIHSEPPKKRGRLLVTFIVFIVFLGAIALWHYNVGKNTSGGSEQLLEKKDLMDQESSIIASAESFTNRKIIDYNSAISAVQEKASAIGYENALAELQLYAYVKVEGICFYRLQQYYKGYPVYGRYITVMSSEQGESLGFVSSCLDVDEELSLVPSLTIDQAEKKIKEYATKNWGVLYDNISISQLSDESLIIFNQEDTSHLVYQLSVSNGSEYTVLIDAMTGEVLDSTENVSSIINGTN